MERMKRKAGESSIAIEEIFVSDRPIIVIASTLQNVSFSLIKFGIE
jgi:hypothetical protein